MARELRTDGFQGITTNSTYDAWTPARAYSHYHGGVRILSETASAKIATPITVTFEQLRSREGYDPQKESANFGPVWKGGAWHLRDITKYMTAAAFKLLEHAANNRGQWLQRFYEIGKEAVRPRRNGELFGFVILPGDRSQFRSRRLVNLLREGGVEVTWSRKPKRFASNGQTVPNESWIVRLDQPYGRFAKALLEEQHYPNLRDTQGHPIAPYDVTAHTLSHLMGVEVLPVVAPFTYSAAQYIEKSRGVVVVLPIPKLGLYRSHVPSMDEGWTRWVLLDAMRAKRGDEVAISLEDDRIRRGNLVEQFNSIIIPDQAPRTILNGYAKGTMPEELTGGLGQEGVKALREFVDQGGTLVFLNRAAEFAIEQFKLPIRNVVAGIPRTEFYVPGSILRLELDTSHPVAKGMPKETIAWAENSPVFEVVGDAANVRVIGWYPKDKDPLLSGWLLGGDRIKGKAALVEVTLGKGRVILFGFRPQYRGQSRATYPLLFNALK